MGTRMIPFLVAACFFVFSAQGYAQGQSGRWQTGRLVSVQVDGQGPDLKAKPRGPAVWWTYGVCARDRTYYAVLRQSPSSAGLTVGAMVKFSADRSLLYLINSAGERHVLRIVRQDNGKPCR